MRPINAVKAVLRATGRGSTDAIQSHVPLDFSSTSSGSMSSNHGSTWENDVTQRDTSCVLELRNLYRSAAEAQEIALRLHVFPRGPFSFPTHCIVSVGGSYAQSDEALVREGGRDIVLREWNLDHSQLLSSPQRPFELELPLRAIMNIASLVAPPSSARDPPVCRVFLGLRFVGCCDASRRHLIKQITAEYVVSTTSRASQEREVEVSALSTYNPFPKAAVTHTVRNSPSGRVDDSHESSIEIFVDEAPNNDLGSQRIQTDKRSAPSRSGSADLDLDINTPATSRRQTSASPSLARPAAASAAPMMMAAEELEYGYGDTPIVCAPISSAKTPPATTEYKTRTALSDYAAVPPASSASRNQVSESIPKRRPPPVDAMAGMTPSRLHTVVAMSPAGVVDSPRVTPVDDGHHQPDNRLDLDEALPDDSTTKPPLKNTIHDMEDASTASLASYAAAPVTRTEGHRQSVAESWASAHPPTGGHDIDTSPIPTIGSDSRTRAAVLPGMIRKAEELQQGQQRHRACVSGSREATSAGILEADVQHTRSPSPTVSNLHALSRQLATLVTEVRDSLSQRREEESQMPPLTAVIRDTSAQHLRTENQQRQTAAFSAPSSRTSSPFRRISTPSPTATSSDGGSHLVTMDAMRPLNPSALSDTHAGPHLGCPSSIRVTPSLVPCRSRFNSVMPRSVVPNQGEVAADMVIASRVHQGIVGNAHHRRSHSSDSTQSLRPHDRQPAKGLFLTTVPPPIKATNTAAALLQEVEAIVGSLDRGTAQDYSETGAPLSKISSQTVPTAPSIADRHAGSGAGHTASSSFSTSESGLQRSKQFDAAASVRHTLSSAPLPDPEHMTRVEVKTQMNAPPPTPKPSNFSLPNQGCNMSRFTVASRAVPESKLATKDINVPLHISACPPPPPVVSGATTAAKENTVVAWCEKHHRTRDSTARRVLAIVRSELSGPNGCTIYLNKKDGTLWSQHDGEKTRQGCELLEGEVVATVGALAFADREAVHQRHVKAPHRCVVLRESPTVGDGREALIIAFEVGTDEDMTRVVDIIGRSLGGVRR